MAHYVFSLRGITRNLATQAYLTHRWLDEEEGGGRRRRRKKKAILQIGLYLTQQLKKKKKKKIKLKISESSTLSLQGDVREYIDTVITELSIYCRI
jgi:hypothetical protein